MAYQLLARVPVLYHLAHVLIRWDVPGAWTAYETLMLSHLEGRAARFRLSDGSQIWMPLTWPGLITGRGLTGYEPQATQYFAAQIAAAPQPVSLFDWGAYVGVFTHLILQNTFNINRIIAYEPNPTSFSLLEQN